MPDTPTPRIHPTAVVDPRAELGRDVEIGPYCVVDAGAVIGDGCRLDAHVRVFGCVSIGPGTSIRTASVLGGEPQDVKYRGESTRVVIGARGRIHEHVTVHRGTGEGTGTVIGDDVMLMATSHVGHNCRVGNNVTLVNGSMLGGHADIGERVIVSGNAAVHQFCRVGRLALVGGGCMVTKDAPPFSIVVGSYPVRWRATNTVGMRRAGIASAQRTAIRQALARLFRSGESPAQVAREELSQSPVAEVAEIARFVLKSKRGICAGLRGRTRGGDREEDN
jgi:UDP-N-acetylglucosamine acyltransferase